MRTLIYRCGHQLSKHGYAGDDEDDGDDDDDDDDDGDEDDDDDDDRLFILSIAMSCTHVFMGRIIPNDHTHGTR